MAYGNVAPLQFYDNYENDIKIEDLKGNNNINGF